MTAFYVAILEHPELSAWQVLLGGTVGIALALAIVAFVMWISPWAR